MSTTVQSTTFLTRFVWVETLIYGRQIGRIERVTDNPFHGQNAPCAFIIALPGNPFWTEYTPLTDLEFVQLPETARAETAELEAILEADPDYQAYLMELDRAALDEERHLCPCCGEPLHQFDQPSLFADRPTHHLAECHTSDCPLEMVTLSVEHFARLTDADIASYVKAAAHG